MNRADIQNETDIERLRQIALVLESETRVLYRRLSELRTALAEARGEDRVQLELELKLLQERLTERESALFGTRSERRGRPEGAPEKEQKAKKQQTGHGPTPQPQLERVEVEHVLDEADRPCPRCGHDLSDMKGQFEESDEIDVIEREYRIVRHKRQKCRCSRCGHIEAALGPERLIPGGRYSVDFAVQVAVDKYAQHLPLERQVKRMKRAGLTVTSQTLSDQILALVDHLWPSYVALHMSVLSQAVVGVDETSWRVMGRAAGNSKRSKRWWVWTLRNDTGTCHVLLPSRGQDAAKLVLRDFDGIAVVDGYGVYEALEKAATRRAQQGELPGAEDPEILPDFTRACCWAHARREFHKAAKHSTLANQLLDQIAQMYAVEARAREGASSTAVLHERRARLRQQESSAILDEIKHLIDGYRGLPKLQLGKAIAYVRARWDALTLFLEHPEVPIDNNAAERSVRGVVLGRKNHQGSRSERGTRCASVFYSLIETAVQHDLEPAFFLRTAALRAIQHPGTVTLPWDLAAELAECRLES